MPTATKSQDAEARQPRLLSKIVAYLAGAADAVGLPDSKHNTGRLLAKAYFWDSVTKYARGQSEAAWDVLEKEKIIDLENLGQGDHVLAESPSLTVTAKISAPVRRFNADRLAELLSQSKFKVPLPVAKQFVEQAKVAGNPTKTLAVIEK